MAEVKRLPITTAQIKAKMNSSMELAIKMAGDALEAVSQDLEAKPTTKFKMAQDYIAMFISVDNHIMKEENHRAEKKLKALNEQIKRHDLNEKEGSPSSSVNEFVEVNQSKFKPTMS